MTGVKRVIYLGAPAGFQAAANCLSGFATIDGEVADQSAVVRALGSYDALLDASMKVRITDEMLDRAPRLRVISCATTGSDHIARERFEARGGRIFTLREDGDLLSNLTPAAELSWALLMACARRLPAAVDHVRAGGWVREDFPGLMLNGGQLGLVGCGRLGSWMARYASAFGMKVTGYDPHLKSLPDGIAPSTLADLFATSDAVSIHVHLNEETRGMIDRRLIDRMKPTAILVNTSRGAIVDEAALLDALRDGRLGAAGLDVLDGEPDIADHPLVAYARDHQNLLITPHCGGFSPDAVALVCTRAAEKIRRALSSDT